MEQLNFNFEDDYIMAQDFVEENNEFIDEDNSKDH